MIKYLLCFFLITTLFSSCVIKSGGLEYYPVESDDTTYTKEIEHYNIKYVSTSTWDIFWTNIYRKKGVFAENVHKNGDKIYYTPLKEEYTKKLKLKPKFNFWDKFGFIFIIPISILVFFGYMYLKDELKI